MSRELDAEVAVKIFGYEVRMLGAAKEPECGCWEICIGCDPRMDPSPEERTMFHLDCDKPGHRVHPCILIPATAETSEWWEVCPDYSSDMGDAEKILDWLKDEVRLCRHDGGFWDCLIGKYVNSGGHGGGEWVAEHKGYAKYLPEAICIAALRAVEAEG